MTLRRHIARLAKCTLVLFALLILCAGIRSYSAPVSIVSPSVPRVGSTAISVSLHEGLLDVACESKLTLEWQEEGVRPPDHLLPDHRAEHDSAYSAPTERGEPQTRAISFADPFGTTTSPSKLNIGTSGYVGFAGIGSQEGNVLLLYRDSISLSLGTRTSYLIHLAYPLAATAAWPLISTIQYLRHRNRPKSGHCPACGYDLRATPDRCPECGKPVRPLTSDPR
jgi:hypothetical protein